MLKKIASDKMGKSDLGWLKSLFHFSFAEYYNPQNTRFGVLRVLNDDLVAAGSGFDLHPHRDMEIISYIVDGQLSHGDSMGNESTLVRGNVQYMSAGRGVFHSEHNRGNEVLRFLQIWIFPDEKNLKPNYGEYRFDWDLRKNKWLNIVGSRTSDAPIKIYQDANIYVLDLDKGNSLDFKIQKDRQAYLVQIEGSSSINEISMQARDAMEIVEEDIDIIAEENSHIMLIEMKKAE